jgi:hypothetical protein
MRSTDPPVFELAPAPSVKGMRLGAVSAWIGGELDVVTARFPRDGSTPQAAARRCRLVSNGSRIVTGNCCHDEQLFRTRGDAMRSFATAECRTFPYGTTLAADCIACEAASNAPPNFDNLCAR